MSLSRRQFITFASVSACMPISAWGASSDLQKQLQRLIKRQRQKGMISASERTAWSVYDFKTNRKLITINENRPMQAASMVKLFVALAYFYLHKRSPRKYPYGRKQRVTIENMLVRSSNSSTNLVMRWCGGPHNVARLCQRATGNRFKQLRIVEYIPAGGRTYRNKASAHDYSRFLYALWHNQLPSSQEIKRIMSIKNNDRITTDSMSRNITVYDKTGSTGHLCGDAGIVKLSGKNNAYTFIGIIERRGRPRSYTQWIRSRGDVMRDASNLVYRYMKKQYHL